MGRYRKVRILPFIVILMVCLPELSFAQARISGIVKRAEDEVALPFASVILKDSTNALIRSYATTNAQGEFDLLIKEKGAFNLHFTAFGYTAEIVPLQIDTLTQNLYLAIKLEETSYDLDEVVISTERPMVEDGDTLSFRVDHYKQGNEQTVEDLLKRIPGLSVEEDGTVKVGNQEIEKLMIEGDDLFEKGYRSLSRNMPAYPVKEVQLLRNFSNNPALKGIEDSDKVALNIKLDEAYKRIWFGNVKLALDQQGFYDGRLNLMNFGKKNKYYFLGSTNKIGNDVTGEIGQLIQPYRTDEAGSIGDDQNESFLLNLSPPRHSLKRNRTHFNNAKLLSGNAVFNPTEKLKIKPLAFFKWDQIDFFSNTVSKVNIPGQDFTNNENYRLLNNENIVFGKLDVTQTYSKKKILQATTKFSSGNFDADSDLNFNGLATL